MTDEELILGIAQGQATAFNTLYLRFRQKVFSTVCHYLQDKEEVEEIVQDVFIEVFKSARSYNGKASVNTWIYRITVNKCLDRCRYRTAKKRFGFIVSLFGYKDAADQVADLSADDPDIAEQKRLLNSVINTLPENQKTALILTQLEELSIKETATIMSLTPKAVESLTQRAKANLKKKLNNRAPKGNK